MAKKKGGFRAADGIRGRMDQPGFVRQLTAAIATEYGEVPCETKEGEFRFVPPQGTALETDHTDHSDSGETNRQAVDRLLQEIEEERVREIMEDPDLVAEYLVETEPEEIVISEAIASTWDEDVLDLWAERSAPTEPALLKAGPNPTDHIPLVERFTEEVMEAEADKLEALDLPDEDAAHLVALMSGGVMRMLLEIVADDADRAHAYYDEVLNAFAHVAKRPANTEAPPQRIDAGAVILAALEERVRQAVMRLDAQALQLPRTYREIAARIAEVRTEFQLARHALRVGVDDLAHRAAVVNADLDVLKARLERQGRSSPEALKREYAATIAAGQKLIDGHEANDERYHATELRLVDLQLEYHRVSEGAQTLQLQIDRVPDLCRFFDLPFPAEIQEQVRHARTRVERANDNRPNPVMIEHASYTLPGEYERLVESMPARRVYLDTLIAKIPEMPSVFKDSTDRMNDLERLMVVGYHLVATESSKNGRTVRVVTRVLCRAGLMQEAEGDDAIRTLSGKLPQPGAVGRFFTHKRMRNFDLYLPTDNLRDTAKRYLELCKDQEEVCEKIRQAKIEDYEASRVSWKQKIAVGDDS